MRAGLLASAALLGLQALPITSVQAQELQPWRVCVPDAPFPPYLNNDPARLGVAERLMVEAGRRAGLQIQFERLPYQRCAALVRSGSLEALVAPAVAAESAGLQFPRRGNELDPQRLLARVALVWLKRPDSPLQWDGRQVQGLESGAAVGMRSGMVAGVGRLQALGFKVDSSARDAGQLLRMVEGGRVAAAVLLEAELRGVDADLVALRQLERPLLVEQYYAAAPSPLAPERQALLTEWWRQISLLRDSSAFRP